MPRNSLGVWGRPQGDPASPDVLGSALHGGQGKSYYGPPFKGYNIFIQGLPLSPTLFNMVVDAVICHWVTVVAETEAGIEGLGLPIRDLEAYF